MRLIITFIIVLTTTLVESQTVVSNELFRKVYLGIDNPISVESLNVREKNIILKSDDGTISKVKKIKYNWRICTTQNHYVYLKVYNKNKLIDSFAFKVESVPNPTLTTWNQDGEYFFKHKNGISSSIDNFVVEGIHVEIERFLITIIKTNGDTLHIVNNSANYSSNSREEFNKLNKGDKVTLSDFIVIVGCETRRRKLTQVLSSVYSGKEYEFRY